MLAHIISFMCWAKLLAMAWRSHGKTNQELVEALWKNGVIKTEIVKDVMLKVDRGDFVSQSPYIDSPQSIGYNVTISAPHMHAAALELLKDYLRPGNRALDIGSGSGILTACMGYMVSPNGKAIGIEHMSSLVEISKKNIGKHHSELLEKNIVIILDGDGRKGNEELGPYHAIHVGAAAPAKPEILIKQLAKGGRLICPVNVEWGHQEMMQYDKDTNGKVTEKGLMGVMYVPLTDKQKQWSHDNATQLPT